MFYFYLLILLHQKRLGEFLPQEIPRNWKTSSWKKLEDIFLEEIGRNWKTKNIEKSGIKTKHISRKNGIRSGNHVHKIINECSILCHKIKE